MDLADLWELCALNNANMYNHFRLDMKTRMRKITGQLIKAFFLLWLLPALACNYPQVGVETTLSQEQARETLIAQLVATAWEANQPGQAGPGLVSPQLTETAQAIFQPGDPQVTSTPYSDPIPTPSPDTSFPPSDLYYFYYKVQPGDTLNALAGRFEVDVAQITSETPIRAEGLLPAGQLLVIPNLVEMIFELPALFPDSEIIFSPSSMDFPIEDYIYDSEGYLGTYLEQIDDEVLSGAGIVRRVAYNTSINPRLLLAVLEYRSGWVLGQPRTVEAETHPLGFYVPGYSGLYKELSLAAKQVNIAYYAWRIGGLTQLRFPNGARQRIDPQANAGTVAVQDLFARFYSLANWEDALYGQNRFNLLYAQMFGDPWTRAAQVGALFPAELVQPPLELPFQPGERWSLTGGPHVSWNTGTPRGAVDFAPVTGEPACAVSSAWATASASGLVTRSERGVVVIDLDGDGFEQTGWALVYLHIAERERVQVGTRLNVDERIGHPSCEGGTSTGTHVHLARKFNGEWLPASGVVPFILSGWEVKAGERAYEGLLVKGDRIVTARPEGSSSSSIVR
jgi:LasA protease